MNYSTCRQSSKYMLLVLFFFAYEISSLGLDLQPQQVVANKDILALLETWLSRMYGSCDRTRVVRNTEEFGLPPQLW